MSRLMFGLLIIGMAGVTVSNYQRSRRVVGTPLDFTPILPGDELRAPLRPLADEVSGDDGGGCQVYFAVLPQCPACRALTDAFVEAGRAHEPLWLSLTDSVRTHAYVADHGVPIEAVRMAVTPDPETRIVDFGIAAVPTRLEVSDGTVTRIERLQSLENLTGWPTHCADS